MNTKLVREYVLLTFSVMALCWGGCALLSTVGGWTLDHILMKVLYMIGGFSPTIASFISLKRSRRVASFKAWLKAVFDVRHPLWVYGLVAIFTAVYYLVGCGVNGFSIGAPPWMAVVIVPMMLVGGGNEEVGWRMILQPELEKAVDFHAATWITAVLWWVWHLPLFFIAGTANATMNYWLFGILCLALSYAMATVRQVSDGVFPCIVLHCLINGLSAVLVFSLSLVSCAVTLGVTVAIAVLVRILQKRLA